MDKPAPAIRPAEGPSTEVSSQIGFIKIGFLEESPNQKSATRLIFVYGCFWAMLLCSYLAFTSKASPGEIIALFGSIVGVLSGTKLMQKKMEVKNDSVTAQ